MTRDEFSEAIVTGRLREKVEGRLKKDYPTTDVSEAVSYAFYNAAKRISTFNNIEHLNNWLHEAATFNVKRRAEKNKRQAQLNRNYRTVAPRRYDPYRRLDWRIDLERAICKVVPNTLLQRGLWHMIVEGYTRDDVVEMLAARSSKRRAGGWQIALQRALAMTRHEMKRKGYRKLR